MIVNNPSFAIAGIHLTTIIRYGLIALIGLYLLVAHKYKENRKLLIFYGILIFIYTLLHHINASDFYTLIPGGIDYSFFEELLYIVRYMVPIFLTYAICTENISKNTFDKISRTIHETRNDIDYEYYYSDSALPIESRKNEYHP